MTKLVMVLTLVSAFWGSYLQAASSSVFTWPNGAKAAVNLAYDDALNSQLDNALPDLNRFGLRGSFYLDLSSPSIMLRLTEWRAAAEQGHELGNHTLYHPCSGSGPGREWVAPHRDLDKLSVAQMVDQISLANSFLHAIDGRTERTFTAPCLDKLAAGEDYWPAIKSLVIAIKGKIGGVTDNMSTLDAYEVGVDGPTNVSGAALIARVKEAKAKGTMINFTFHGIGGDHLAVSREAHAELLAYLANHKDDYWVDTFVNIMTYVKQQQATLR